MIQNITRNDQAIEKYGLQPVCSRWLFICGLVTLLPSQAERNQLQKL
jgi:hypothetical protein